MPRFRAAFCATFRPGASVVPLADRIICLTGRSSTRTTSKRRATSVESFSAQSLRRAASRALTFAIASFALLLRSDPRLALASFRCGRSSRAASRADRPGAFSSSPVDSAALTATPPPPRLLLDAQVPHVPGVRAVPEEHRLRRDLR